MTRNTQYAIHNTQYAIRNTHHTSPVTLLRGLESRLTPHFLLLLFVALLASAQLWGPGIVNTRGGGDSPFLLQRLHQMTTNLRAGVFPVRWMPDAAYGLGYPFFNHYSALPFYVAACFNLLGLDPLTALKLTQTLGFVFAALAMYGWVYHLWRRRTVAWLAAVAYTVAPFHLVNVYVRGDSLSEFYAFAFYPLVLWALERVTERETKLFRKIWFLALAYAGLVLSHNISAFIFSPFALLYLLLLSLKRGVSKPVWALGRGLIGLLLGAALSAWAWLPALLERGYVQSGTLTLGYFNYARHFRTGDLVQPGLLFDYSIAVKAGGSSPFAMGGPQALVALAGLSFLIYLAFKRRTASRPSPTPYSLLPTPYSLPPTPYSLAFLTTGLLLSTLMITPLSRPLWDHVPLLATVQFPWRFLSVQSLFAAVAAGALVLQLKRVWAWSVAGGVGALLVASTLLPLQPERLPVGPEDVTPARLQLYELFTGNIGTTIRYEWLPRDADPRPFISDAVIAPEAPAEAIPLAGRLVDATRTRRRPTGQTWQVQAGDKGASLAFPLLYWPGWRAWIDGERAPVRAVPGAGYLALDLPPGDHTVRLQLTRSPLRAVAETLSLATLLVLAYCVLRIAYCVLRNTQYAIRNTQYAILLLLSLLFLSSQSSSPPNHLDDLTMDFVNMPYLHHNPDGVALGDGARLSSYTFSDDQLAPGDTLTVTLHWDRYPILRLRSGQVSNTQSSDYAQDRSPVTLRLVSPAEHIPDLNSGPLGLSQDTAPLAETTVHRLVVPQNAPRGLYLVQVQLEGSEHAPLYLRPVRVPQGAPLPPDAPVLALVGPDIRLHAAALETSGPYLVARLEWSAVRRIAANYQVSVRLLDPAGNQRASRDTQPGYGFAPTSLWRLGERVGDRYNLPLPDDLPPGDGYRLMFVFYRMPNAVEVARVTLPPFALPLETPVTFAPPPRRFTLPPLPGVVNVDFGEQIRLAGYDLARKETSLDLTLWWTALRQPPADYTVFVHLVDPATEAIAAQHDAMPRQGRYPTSGWLAGEVVSDTVRLDLQDVPPGSYRLTVGLYDVVSGDRLPAIAPGGDALPHARAILPPEIEIEIEIEGEGAEP